VGKNEVTIYSRSTHKIVIWMEIEISLSTKFLLIFSASLPVNDEKGGETLHSVCAWWVPKKKKSNNTILNEVFPNQLRCTLNDNCEYNFPNDNSKTLWRHGYVYFKRMSLVVKSRSPSERNLMVGFSSVEYVCVQTTGRPFLTDNLTEKCA